MEAAEGKDVVEQNTAIGRIGGGERYAVFVSLAEALA